MKNQLATQPYSGMNGWVSRNLKRWQKQNGFTNKQAAAKIGTPLRTFNDWKCGDHAPRGFALQQLREALNK